MHPRSTPRGQAVVFAATIYLVFVLAGCVAAEPGTHNLGPSPLVPETDWAEFGGRIYTWQPDKILWPDGRIATHASTDFGGQRLDGVVTLGDRILLFLGKCTYPPADLDHAPRPGPGQCSETVLPYDPVNDTYSAPEPSDRAFHGLHYRTCGETLWRIGRQGPVANDFEVDRWNGSGWTLVMPEDAMPAGTLVCWHGQFRWFKVPADRTASGPWVPGPDAIYIFPRVGWEFNDTDLTRFDPDSGTWKTMEDSLAPHTSIEGPGMAAWIDGKLFYAEADFGGVQLDHAPSMWSYTPGKWH